jgi:hypothetical protein
MAVYEYGDGGKSCFHSTLHPAGVERIAIQDHPEKLFVPAKNQKCRLRDVEHTLGTSRDSTGYETSEAPRIPREPRSVTCCRSGEEGHVARECEKEDD